jgi:dipeptidyl-peptidase-4
MPTCRTSAVALACVCALTLTVVPAAPPGKILSVADAVDRNFFGEELPKTLAWLPDGSAFLYFRPPAEGRPAAIVQCGTDTGPLAVVLTEAQVREALVRKEITESPGLDRFVLSPAGRFLLIPAGDGAVLWDRIAKAPAGVLSGLGDSPDLAWSPDETRLAYSSQGDLWVVSRESGERRRVARGKAPLVTCGEADWLYGEELDVDRAFWWSPDGKALAYFRFDETGVPTFPLVDQAELDPEVRPQFYPKPGEKNPRVTLEVVRLEPSGSEPFVVAESGVGYLARATWLPSSSALAYQLLDRRQVKLSLVLFELGSGERRVLLEETSPTWVNVLDEPRFFEKRPGFLWRSERDGYAHLYACPLDGSAPVQLTRGPWVVDELLAVDETRGFAYVAGNRESAIEKQVYRVDLNGPRAAVRLTEQAGWHEAEFSPTSSHFLDTRSRAGTPETLHLVETSSRAARPLWETPCPQLAEYGFSTPEFFTFRGPAGQTLHAVLYKPRGFTEGRRYPVVVEVYGGPWAQVVQDRWNRRDAPLTQLFTQAGFVYASVDGRGSGRRGRAFEGALFERLGKAELEDQLAALESLKSLPFVDGERVGIWGWSYGGFMALYALAHTGAYRCGAAVAPVADWLSYDTCYTERYLKLPSENAGGYAESSPLNAASALSAPLFLAHGLMDDNVHFTNSARMTQALASSRKPFETAFYPKNDHGIRGDGARADLFTRLLDFFERHLKPNAGAAP